MKNNIQNNIEFLLALKLKFKLNSKQTNFLKHEKKRLYDHIKKDFGILTKKSKFITTPETIDFFNKNNKTLSI